MLHTAKTLTFLWIIL